MVTEYKSKIQSFKNNIVSSKAMSIWNSLSWKKKKYGGWLSSFELKYILQKSIIISNYI